MDFKVGDTIIYDCSGSMLHLKKAKIINLVYSDYLYVHFFHFAYSNKKSGDIIYHNINRQNAYLDPQSKNIDKIKDFLNAD